MARASLRLRVGLLLNYGTDESGFLGLTCFGVFCCRAKGNGMWFWVLEWFFGRKRSLVLFYVEMR